MNTEERLRKALAAKVAQIPESERWIVEAYLDGATLAELGTQLVVSGERVRQIVAAATSAVGITNAATIARAARRPPAPPKPKRTEKVCPVCGRRLPFPAGTTRVTDSSECAAVWPTFRFKTDRGRRKQRIAVARYTVRNPDKIRVDGEAMFTKKRVAWAKRILRQAGVNV